jgi:hypothetical protein
MAALSCYVTNATTNNYMTWNSSYAVSQLSTMSPSTNQDWDIIVASNGYYLCRPMTEGNDCFVYLKSDGTNIFQNSCYDYLSVWEVSSGNWKHINSGKYLGVSVVSGVATLNLQTSTSSATKWKNGTTQVWGDVDVNPLYVTISGTNYYLQADMDGYTMTVSTSLSTTNPTMYWSLTGNLAINPVFTINPPADDDNYYLRSNGDGTVTLTTSPDNYCNWTWPSLNSSFSVLTVMSQRGGYLQFDSDGTTMSENITTPTPYPGAVSGESQVVFTEID